MKKLALAIPLILSLLSACVTTDTSPSQTYRPQGSSELWTITGSVESTVELTGASRHLRVFIDGNEAISGQISDAATGELSGSYRGHAVVSICSSELRTSDYLAVQCLILIDNERAATLTF